MVNNGAKLQRITAHRTTFYWALRSLHKSHPYSVTSWWRSPAHNSQVGGLPNSLHLVGLAVDCTLEPGENKQEFLRHAQSLGLHGQVEIDHVHLQATAPTKTQP